MRRLPTIPIGIALIITACGASPGTRPEDMTAAEHRAAARQHDREGAQAPYIRGSYVGGFGGRYHGDPYYGGSSWSHGWYPWGYYWNSGAGHYAEAQEHEDAAAVLEKRYRATCALVAPNTASTPPLDRFVRSIDTIDRGVVLQLAPDAGPPDMLLAEIQCHNAWLALAPRVETGYEITGVAGAEYMIRAEPAAITVTITASDPQAIAELRRRAELLTRVRANRAVSSTHARP